MFQLDVLFLDFVVNFSFKAREWLNLLLRYDVISIFLNIFRIPPHGVQLQHVANISKILI